MVSPDENILALDNQFCFALYAANRAVTALYRPLLEELGLTYPQYLVMLVLWEEQLCEKGIRVSRLGQRLRLDSGTLTPLLKRLAERGLLVRSRSEQDERVVELFLTEAGRALEHQARNIPGKLLCAAGEEPLRLMALRDELHRLVRHLDDQAEPSG